MDALKDSSDDVSSDENLDDEGNSPELIVENRYLLTILELRS